MARRVSVLGIMVEYVPERVTRESTLGIMVEYQNERKSRASVLGIMVEQYTGELVALLQGNGGIPSEEAFGNNTELITNITLFPTGIASEEAFGGAPGLRVLEGFSAYDIYSTPTGLRSKAITVSMCQPLILGGTWLQDFSEELADYSHEINADMWFVNADFTLNLTKYDLAQWIMYGLGRHIVVKSPTQEPIWEGFIDSFTISVGQKQITVGPLTDIGNRVYATYTPLYISGTTGNVTKGTARETPLTNDTASQVRYGIIEKNLAAGECIVTTAYDEGIRFRDEFLIENAYPKSAGSLSYGSSSPASVKISCYGYWKWLEAYIYNYRVAAGSFGYSTTNTKLLAVLAASPNAIFSTNYSKILANTAITPNIENNNQTALTIIKGLTAAGDPFGNRWVFGIGRDRIAYYNQISSLIKYEYKVEASEQKLVLYGTDTAIDAWDIKPGDWYLTSDIYKPIAYTSPYSQYTAAYIESVRFSMPDQFSLTEGKISKISQMLAYKGLGSI